MRPRVFSQSVSSALACWVLACGAQSSGTASRTTAPSAHVEAAPAPATAPEPTPADILRRGCPATYAEALSLVGTLRAAARPEALGTEVIRDFEPITEQRPSAPEWPDVCTYAEGDCRVQRYESGCVDYVDFRCGVPADAPIDLQPCNRPDRP